jgi:ankyrin repeat protein
MHGCIKPTKFSVPIIKMLLEKPDVDIHARDNEDRTAFLHLCKAYPRYWDDLSLAREFLNWEGIDVNAKDTNGEAVLIYACRSKHSGLIKMLLERDDTAINTKSSTEYTALIVKCRVFWNSQVDTLKLILGRKDLEINATNQHGNTAFVETCKRGYEWEELVGSLLERQDIDVNIKNREGKMALMIAKEKGYEKL